METKIHVHIFLYVCWFFLARQNSMLLIFSRKKRKEKKGHMVTQMFRPSYFTLLFTEQPITGNRYTYNMHNVCDLRKKIKILQLFESNFKCLCWLFYIFLFCQFSWTCCAFLFISFLHSSLSRTKSLSVWPVLTYFSQRSKHFRSSFRNCLKILRGLPGFFVPDLIHHALSFGNSIIWHPFYMASISEPDQSTIRFHSSDGSSFVCCV